MAALLNDKYNVVQRYARNPSSLNRQAFLLLLLYTESNYLLKALNLYVPDLSDYGVIDRRIDFLLGNKRKPKTVNAFAALDAKSFIEAGAAAFGLKLDLNGKIIGNK